MQKRGIVLHINSEGIAFFATFSGGPVLYGKRALRWPFASTRVAACTTCDTQGVQTVPLRRCIRGRRCERCS